MLNIVSGLFSEGAPPVSPTSYESIQTVTVGSGGAADITFSSIPGTYKHLQIRVNARCAGAYTGSTAVRATFNSDTTLTNYWTHYLRGNGTAAAATDNNGPNYTFLIGTNNNTANAFSGAIVDILDYSNTNKNTVTRALSGGDWNGSGEIYFSSVSWNNTAAVNNIVITAYDGNMMEYSSFALYGIKGA